MERKERAKEAKTRMYSADWTDRRTEAHRDVTSCTPPPRSDKDPWAKPFACCDCASLAASEASWAAFCWARSIRLRSVRVAVTAFETSVLASTRALHKSSSMTSSSGSESMYLPRGAEGGGVKGESGGCQG